MNRCGASGGAPGTPIQDQREIPAAGAVGGSKQREATRCGRGASGGAATKAQLMRLESWVHNQN